MPISQTLLNLQEIKEHFLKIRPFFVKAAKNRGDRLNRSCRKTRLKNITNAHVNRFGLP